MRARLLAAFAAVYVIWGSTYLAIRFAVETLPPLLMAGARFTIAGLLLLFWSRFVQHAERPSRTDWRTGLVSGALLLLGGNGAVVWAETRVPSGIAALLVAVVPLWMVLLDWLRPGGIRPRALVGVGLVIGIIGVALLARGHGDHRGSAYGWSVAALVAASFCWAFGSVFNRSARKPASPFLGVSMQMITGGVVLFGVAASQNEFARFHFAQITALSFGSWLYLSIAGSLIGYTAYIWLLHVSTPARVATYAYVNPLIAVLLGCTLGREIFSHELLVAGALIIVAVALIVRGGAQSTAKNAAQPKVEAPAVPISK